MRYSVDFSRAITGPDGHQITEVLGLRTTDTERYSVAHVVVPASSKGTTRTNRFDEVLLIIQGNGVIEEGGRQFPVSAGDVFHLPARMAYATHNPNDEPLAFWAICVPAFRPEWSVSSDASTDWRSREMPRGADRLRMAGNQ